MIRRSLAIGAISTLDEKFRRIIFGELTHSKKYF